MESSTNIQKKDESAALLGTVCWFICWPSSSSQISDSHKPAGWMVGWNQCWFCWCLWHFLLTWVQPEPLHQLWAPRSAERNKRLHFLFRKQLWWNLLYPVVLESKCKSGTPRAGCRSVMEMMEKTSDQEKSKCGCLTSQEGENQFILTPVAWWWWSKNTFLVQNNLHVLAESLHQCYMTDMQLILNNF